jgi:hypothetical protein
MKQSLFLDKSIQFAKACEKEFGKTESQYVRGTKQAGFVVLYQSSMPSCLVEIGFISNPAEETYLNSNEGQTEIAQKLANAFKEFKYNYENNAKKDQKETPTKTSSKLSANNAALIPPDAIIAKPDVIAEKKEPVKTIDIVEPQKEEVKKPIANQNSEVLEPKKTELATNLPVNSSKIDVDDTEDIYAYKPSKNNTVNTDNVVLYNKFTAVDTLLKSKDASSVDAQPKKTPLFIEDKKSSNNIETTQKNDIAKIDAMKYPKDIPTLYKEKVVEQKQQEAPKTQTINSVTNKPKPEAKKTEPLTEKPALGSKNESVFKIQVKASKAKITDVNPSASLGKLEESFEGGLYKYLLGSFKTKEEAKLFLEKVKANGIVDAFIVKYKNGVRVPLDVN